MKNPTFIEVYNDTISKKSCDHIISKFDELYNRQIDKNFAGKREGLDVSDRYVFLPDEQKNKFCKYYWDKYIKNYCEKYHLIGETYETLGIYDGIKFQKTEPGQGFHGWHSEFGSIISERSRVLVFSLFLNDIEEGGETEFLYQNLRVRPKAGRFAIWPAGYTHIHRGNPPLKDDKYIITSWVQLKY